MTSTATLTREEWEVIDVARSGVRGDDAWCAPIVADRYRESFNDSVPQVARGLSWRTLAVPRVIRNRTNVCLLLARTGHLTTPSWAPNHYRIAWIDSDDG